MSGLGLLAVDAEDAVARSPMEGRARAAGASFAVRRGWNVAVSYGPDPALERSLVERTVGFADRSSLGKFELHGVHGRAMGMAERSEDGWLCPVTPARALVLGGLAEAGTVVDVTCELARDLVIAGAIFIIAAVVLPRAAETVPFHGDESEWINAGREHSGIILAPQQRVSVGEQLRCILRIRATATAESMRNQIEFLTNWS